MRKSYLIIALFFTCSAGAQQLSLRLTEAKTKALSLNKDAQISALELERAEKVVKETLAIGLPQVTARGSFQNFLNVPTTVLPDFISPAVYGVLIAEDLVPEGSGGTPGFIPAQFGTNFNVSGGVTWNQLIFNGSYLIGLQAAKSYVELSRIQKDRKDVDVKLSVSEAYYTVLLSAENTSVLKESAAALERMMKEIEAMYEQGFTEEQEVMQLRLTLNNLQSQVKNSERQEVLTKQLLNFQIGLPLDQELILTDDLETLINDPLINETIAISEPDLSAHPDMKLMDSNVLLQGLRLKEQRSQYLPSLNGFFNYQKQAQRTEFNFFESGQDWFPSTVWGLELSVPIFSSGMKHYKVQQMEIGVKEAELQREQAIDGLSLAADTARSDYLFTMENYQTMNENLDLAISIRDKTRIKYQEGVSTSFELSEMENQFIKAQGNTIQASLNLLNALTAFQKAFNTL